MGNLFKNDRTDEKQHSTTQISPQGQTAQTVGMRFLMNLMGQGAQSWQDYIGSGSHGRPTPQMGMSLQEGLQLDPSSIDPYIRSITHPYTPAGALSVAPGNATGRGVQSLYAAYPQLFAGGGLRQVGQGQQGLTLMDLMRSYGGGG